METAFIRPSPGANKSKAYMTKLRGNNTSKQRNKKRNQSLPERGKMVVFSMRSSQKVVTRRFGFFSTTSTTAGGVIALATLSASDTITFLAAEFTNFAMEFQEYRVLSLTEKFCPATVNATSVTGPYQGMVVIAPWQQFRPTTLSTIEQNDQRVTFSTLEEESFKIVPRFANQKLWNAYGVAYPADRDFGIAYQSGGAVMAISSVIFSTFIEITVAFRVAQ